MGSMNILERMSLNRNAGYHLEIMHRSNTSSLLGEGQVESDLFQKFASGSGIRCYGN